MTFALKRRSHWALAVLSRLSHASQTHQLQLCLWRSTSLNALPLDPAALPEVVRANHARSVLRSGVLSTSGSCRDRRAAASASLASTSLTGWIRTATPCWAATSGSSRSSNSSSQGQTDCTFDLLMELKINGRTISVRFKSDAVIAQRVAAQAASPAVFFSWQQKDEVGIDSR